MAVIPVVDVAPKVKRAPREVMPARVKGKDLMHLSRQLAAFLRAGIPILDGLSLLAEDTSNKTLSRTLVDIAERLRQGSPLGEALDHHPAVFPPAYRSMVRSAELTGNLDVVLDRLTVYVERDVEARRKIRSAMTYPLVVVVLSISVSVLLITFVLPKFRVFFASFHQELPLPTRILLGVSDVFQQWWWALLLGAVVLGVAGSLFLRSDRGRLARDRVILRLPVLGKALQYSVVERFARVFSAMLQAGVPLGDAMNVAAEATNNRPAAIKLRAARERMMSGEGISGPLSDSGVFPPAAMQMMRVGEDTGSLDDQLDVVANFYEKELDEKVKQITTLMEPAVLIVMGVIVGFVALALVTAMYGIYGNVGK
jgi:type IV pilus assembly protein PilC